METARWSDTSGMAATRTADRPSGSHTRRALREIRLLRRHKRSDRPLARQIVVIPLRLSKIQLSDLPFEVSLEQVDTLEA